METAMPCFLKSYTNSKFIFLKAARIVLGLEIKTVTYNFGHETLQQSSGEKIL